VRGKVGCGGGAGAQLVEATVNAEIERGTCGLPSDSSLLYTL